MKLETFNKIVEKKVKKYKEKINEMNENSGNKVNDFQQQINQLNEIMVYLFFLTL